MVESVDTRDLKSLGHCGRVGSSPTSGTIMVDNQSIINHLISFALVAFLSLHHLNNGFAQVVDDITGNHAIGAMGLSSQIACQAVKIDTNRNCPVW